MSRIAHQEYYLTDDEKTQLVQLIRRVAIFTSVFVLAYCVMSNHIHIFVYLPERPEEMPSLDDLLERIATLYGETYAMDVRCEWARLEGLRQGLSEEDRRKYFARMYDISEFMKAIKQRYTMRFNCENEHYGTMWEGRFKSVCVQPNTGPMAAVAAYDDLNPVRAGIVREYSGYAWCSWYAAVHGDKYAQAGYRFIYGMQTDPWDEVVKRHAEVLEDKAGYLGRASRSFVEGGAIGDEGFIREYVQENLSPERKSGPVKLPGGNVWGELRVAREVREKHGIDFMGKGSDEAHRAVGRPGNMGLILWVKGQTLCPREKFRSLEVWRFGREV